MKTLSGNQENKINRGQEKGQSLVELAISITLLLVFISGIVDLGRAIFTQFALQDAAEEGLVYGIANPNQCTQIISRVSDTLNNGVLPSSPTIRVTVNGVDCSPAAALTYNMPMEVIVTSDFTMWTPFFSGNNITLRGTANGTTLRPPPET